MKLTIITITYNNLVGLKRTVESVLKQNYRNWELIVVDGGSADGTKEWLQETATDVNKPICVTASVTSGVAQQSNQENISDDLRFRYVSEPDKGIYDAQNKGIGMAKGEYCYFLNAGDVFANENVLAMMFSNNSSSDILYGNEIVVDGKGKKVGYCKGIAEPTFLDLYVSCMKHQATFIKRALFERFGVYDISYKIDADWEWFLRVIGMHEDVTLEYRDVDISLFEAGGLSFRMHKEVEDETRRIYDTYVLKRMQADYNLFMCYRGLRKAHTNKILRWMLLIIMKLSKFVQ